MRADVDLEFAPFYLKIIRCFPCVAWYGSTYIGKSYQELYLYHCPTNQKISLADFPALSSYSGEWRCDLHPRFSPDGRWVTVDSAHQNGRQIYLVDLAEVELG